MILKQPRKLEDDKRMQEVGNTIGKHDNWNSANSHAQNSNNNDKHGIEGEG